MVWNGVGKLIEIQGIIDAVQYCEILVDKLVECFEEKLEMEEDEKISNRITAQNT